MFQGAMLGLVVFWLILGLLTRQPALFLLALALLGAAWLSRLWEKHCLSRLEYRRTFSRTRVSFGETIELVIEVVNRKPLPLAWLEIEDEIPRDLQPTRGQISPTIHRSRSLLVNLLAPRPYELIRRHYFIPALQRGEHLFGPVRLRSGDLFGSTTREETLYLVESVIVYPRLVDLTELGLPARQPLGNLRASSWLFEDPSRVAGAREYRPGDSMRRIHWAATARTQQLQVKVYEATTSHKLEIFLNLSADDDYWWGQTAEPTALEPAITTAASVAVWALDRGYPVGLHTNGVHRGNWAPVGLEPRADPDQRERILLALGRLQLITARPFGELVADEARRLPFGATVVLVSTVLGARVAEAAISLRARGHAVTILLVDQDSSDQDSAYLAKADQGMVGERVSDAAAGLALPGIGIHRVRVPAWGDSTTEGNRAMVAAVAAGEAATEDSRC